MPPRSKAALAAPDTFASLQQLHPDAHCELDHASPFQLIVATVLSAQTTDKLVNTVTPALFEAYPDAASLAAADVKDVEKILSRIGMFRQKTKNIVGLAKKLVSDHGGVVPSTLNALVALPGVGRKTANVVLGVAFSAPEGVVVDTHIQRLSQRLGWTKNKTPEKIEQDLMALFPQRDWDSLSHVLIFHGRRVCDAKAPACDRCGVANVCPSMGHAEKIGRKPPRKRKKAVVAVPATAHSEATELAAKVVKRAPKKTARPAANPVTKRASKSAR